MTAAHWVKVVCLIDLLTFFVSQYRPLICQASREIIEEIDESEEVNDIFNNINCTGVKTIDLFAVVVFVSKLSK